MSPIWGTLGSRDHEDWELCRLHKNSRLILIKAENLCCIFSIELSAEAEVSIASTYQNISSVLEISINVISARKVLSADNFLAA